MTFGITCSPTIKNLNGQGFIGKYLRLVKRIIGRHCVDNYVDCFEAEEEATEQKVSKCILY